jgi:uncharacterized damage-inducible protein DinB
VQRLPLPGVAALRAEILRFLNDTQGRRNWAHKGLSVAIGNLGVEEARWTPPGGHSVWEQINHVAHWKRFILQLVQGKRPRARQAWPPGGQTLGELREAKADLETLHRALHATVIAMDPDRLVARGARYSAAQLLLGEAAHESYHIGQIFLTRKQYRRLQHSQRPVKG